MVLGVAVPAGASAQAPADPCAAPVTNPVACENTKPGTPESVWGIDGSGDDTIQGYATSISVNKGDPVSFKIKSAAQYTIDIYRLGYYQGNGARLMASNITHSAPQTQPACQVTNGTGLIDCGNWSTSATWTVPSTAVSGLYIAYLKRNDTGGDSQITFVVRDDASHSDVLLQTSDETWQAYNRYGGNSLYNCTVGCPTDAADGYQAAFAVSYNRPFDTAGSSERSWWHSAEYPMIRFLEANGYDISYTSGIDTRDPRQPAQQPQGVRLERPRRVLVARAARRTSRRRATAASTSPSSAATRCSGRRASARARSARAPTGR